MGPYGTTFGGAAIMTQFELDRFFAWPAGQLGVTASFGWTGKTANAFVPCPPIPDGATECPDPPMRTQGDETSFRLLPLSVGAVYRLTVLDDRFKVPLIPYAKAAASYYLWWITAPDGSVAEKPTAECSDPDTMDCDGDRALGASLGVQFSIGLALRAERLDKQAGNSLRSGFGVEHAGFYAELAYAKVDGFGSATKLSVGDFTWFAGLNFEF